jgi:hypothetical protein
MGSFLLINNGIWIMFLQIINILLFKIIIATHYLQKYESSIVYSPRLQKASDKFIMH